MLPDGVRSGFASGSARNGASITGGSCVPIALAGTNGGDAAATENCSGSCAAPRCVSVVDPTRGQLPLIGSMIVLTREMRLAGIPAALA